MQDNPVSWCSGVLLNTSIFAEAVRDSASNMWKWAEWVPEPLVSLRLGFVTLSCSKIWLAVWSQCEASRLATISLNCWNIMQPEENGKKESQSLIELQCSTGAQYANIEGLRETISGLWKPPLVSQCWLFEHLAQLERSETRSSQGQSRTKAVLVRWSLIRQSKGQREGNWTG